VYRALDLARFTVQTFLLHASIVQPLGESGKLKLTQDTTSLEFSINQYLSGYDISLQDMGDQFKALRGKTPFSLSLEETSKTDLNCFLDFVLAFRPLLFLDTRSLLDPKQTSSIPTLILLHHLISRSPIPLPHKHHRWTQAEYVRWLNEHGEKERVGMIQGVLADWEKEKQGGGGEGNENENEEEKEWAEWVRKVLART